MEKARFERSLVHQYLPLNFAAWLVYIAFFTLESSLLLVGVMLDLHVMAWWCVGLLAFGLFLGFWAYAHWNSDEG